MSGSTGPTGGTPYVKGTPIRAEKKPGPNQPCSCGSGKKYKKCCARKNEAPARVPGPAGPVGNYTITTDAGNVVTVHAMSKGHARRIFSESMKGMGRIVSIDADNSARTAAQVRARLSKVVTPIRPLQERE